MEIMRKVAAVSIIVGSLALVSCSTHPEADHPQYLTNTAAIEMVNEKTSGEYTEDDLIQAQEAACPMLADSETWYEDARWEVQDTLDIPRGDARELTEAAGRSECPGDWESKQGSPRGEDTRTLAEGEVISMCEDLISKHPRVVEDPVFDLDTSAIGEMGSRVWSISGEVQGRDGGRVVSDVSTLCVVDEKVQSPEAAVGSSDVMKKRLEMMTGGR